MDALKQQFSALWGRFIAWYRQQGRNTQIGVGCGVLIIVCACCSVGYAALNGGKSSTPTKTPPQQAHQATATLARPSVTATATQSGPRPPTGAVLGGTGQGFAAKFGTPVISASESRTYHATISGQDVSIAITLQQSDDASHTHFVDVKPLDQSTHWDDATAEAIAKTFLPPDAKYAKDMQASGFGLEHIYTSADLAATFPADAFTDANSGNTVTPGTFYISCGNQNEPQGGCSLNLGQ